MCDTICQTSEAGESEELSSELSDSKNKDQRNSMGDAGGSG